MEKDPFYKALLEKIKSPPFVTFCILIAILVVLGMIVHFLRPDNMDATLRCV